MIMEPFDKISYFLKNRVITIDNYTSHIDLMSLIAQLNKEDRCKLVLNLLYDILASEENKKQVDTLLALDSNNLKRAVKSLFKAIVRESLKNDA